MTISRKRTTILLCVLFVFVTHVIAMPPSSSENDKALRNDLCDRDDQCKNEGTCIAGMCLCRNAYSGMFCELFLSQSPTTVISKNVQKRQAFGSSCAFPIKIQSSDLPNGGGMAMDYKFKEFPGRVITTSDINFNCNQGSVLRGSLTISCGYDGLWTINPPICEQTPFQQFSQFNDAPNQRIAARIECSSKSVPVGYSVLVCGDADSCDSQISVCRAFSNMKNVQSGPQFSGASSSCRPGDTKEVMCNEGYHRPRSVITRCLDNGRWDTTCGGGGNECILPFSFNKSKMASGMGMNYRYQESSRRFTAITNIWFRCNRNYIVTGSLVISCTSYGEWDVIVPDCERFQESQGFSNSATEIVARIECNVRSIPASQSIIACSSDGACESGVSNCYASSSATPDMDANSPTFPLWSSKTSPLPPETLPPPPETPPPSTPRRTPPPRRIPPPQPPTPVEISTETLIPTTVSKIDTKVIQTQSPGFCPPPSEFPLGSYKISVSSSFRGIRPENMMVADTILEYSCRFPYQIRGPSERICLPSGEWSDLEPTCKPICGLGMEPKTPQIIGGMAAKQGSHPWQVAIKTYISGSDVRDIVCGGAILNEKWVLTAAHCITQPQTTTLLSQATFLLFFGKYYVDLNMDSSDVLSRKVLYFTVHPSYNPITFDSDLGLIVVESPLEFNDKILPVCLPPPTSLTTFQEGRKGVVAGWGYVDRNRTSARQLMVAELPVVSNKKCEESYGKFNFKSTVTDNMFCVGFEQGGINTCLGDSGGPMAFYDNGKYVLEGIVSWGNGDDCAGAGFYGGFVRVRNFVHWIGKYVAP